MNDMNKPNFNIVNLLIYNVLNRIYAVLSHITNSLKNDFQLKASLMLTVVSCPGLKILHRLYNGFCPVYKGSFYENDYNKSFTLEW